MSNKGAPSSEVVLREVIDVDISVFFEHQLDPEASAMALFPSRDRETHLAHWLKILTDDTVITKTIVAGEQVAGNIVSWEHEDKRLVGYWIDRPQWGKGIATLALAEFVRQVSQRPLYAYVAKQNVGSIRVLQKCGFQVCEETSRPQPRGGDADELLMKLDVPIRR